MNIKNDPEISMLITWTRARMVLAQRSDRGASAMETAIIAAGLAVLALAVIAIITIKAKNKAKSTPTD